MGDIQYIWAARVFMCCGWKSRQENMPLFVTGFTKQPIIALNLFIYLDLKSGSGCSSCLVKDLSGTLPCVFITFPHLFAPSRASRSSQFPHSHQLPENMILLAILLLLQRLLANAACTGITNITAVMYKIHTHSRR